MAEFIIDCEQFDFSSLAREFSSEVESDASLSAEIIFCGEEEIRRLNRETRAKDEATDVLSYPSLDGIRGKKLKKRDFPDETDDYGGIFLGSIAICTSRAEEQAKEYGHSYERELFYLATHGLFHLLGYDHMTEGDKAEMRAREEGVLARLKLTRDV